MKNTINLNTDTALCSYVTSLLAFLMLMASAGDVHAIERPSTLAEKAGIVERLNQTLDLDLVFKNSKGEALTLRDLLADGRPLIIAPVYYECPRLCTLTQQGLLEAVNAVDLGLGKDFRVASISFNSAEKPEQAVPKAKKYRSLLDPRHEKNAWSFLVGSPSSTEKVMKELGFKYAKDGDEFAHAAALMVVTPGGILSRYFYGVKYADKDLRFALIEASQGRIGSTVDRILMFCFRFDHIQGRYTVSIWKVTRIFCTLFAGLLLASLIIMRIREKVRKSS